VADACAQAVRSSSHSKMGCGASSSPKAAETSDAPPESATEQVGAAQELPATALPESADKLDRRALLERVFAAMDADGNGKVDAREFAAQAKSKAEADMELPMLMHFMDDPASGGDGDGKLSLDEWISGMQFMIGSASDAMFEKEMHDILQVLEGVKMANAEAGHSGSGGGGVEGGGADGAEAADDLDNLNDLDGLLDEMAESAPMLIKAKAIFETLDTDGMGSLSKAELKAGLLANAECKALLGNDLDAVLGQMDIDGDEVITWMEFEIMAKHKAEGGGADPDA